MTTESQRILQLATCICVSVSYKTGQVPVSFLFETDIDFS